MIILVTGRGKTFTKADLLKEARDKGTTYEHRKKSSRPSACGANGRRDALLW
jgi:hypothetical protein